MKKERERLEKEISLLEKQIKKLPAKEFYIAKNGKYYKWYETSGSSRKIVRKKEREYAKKLALRHVWMEKQSLLKRELLAVNLYMGKSPGRIDVDDLLREKGYGELVENEYSFAKKAFDWAREDYPRKSDHPENLTRRTSFGLLVRSKSEGMIAEALYKHGIPFRYEWIQTFNGIQYGIDFTIMNPITGELFFWEHFGSMDDIGYVGRSLQKVKTFSENGIFLGVNLIITGETLDHPFMPDDAERTLRHFFPDIVGL